jgi:AcrR family transcriptional regulator
LENAGILNPEPELAPSDRREAVLRAALELFAERTYGAAPVPEIAARAHVGTGTVYRHFESKEALANAVFRRCKTAMHDGLKAALAGGGTEKDVFLRLWQSLAAMAAADPTALRFLELQHHEEYLDEASRALSDSVFATAEGFVRGGQVSGEVREGDPRILIGLVFGAFVGMFKESCQERFAFDDATIAFGGECAWQMIRR